MKRPSVRGRLPTGGEAVNNMGRLGQSISSGFPFNVLLSSARSSSVVHRLPISTATAAVASPSSDEEVAHSGTGLFIVNVAINVIVYLLTIS